MKEKRRWKETNKGEEKKKKHLVKPNQTKSRPVKPSQIKEEVNKIGRQTRR